ncbi:hypothetical protein [Herbidospora yilanensis]|uniref:hypothetical protein n=1 Tax=Herbidospora yilanensis TaxID=354426 RepID=UPI0007847A6C|nr:hypothetical protein [Herbidospora yilanensis]
MLPTAILTIAHSSRRTPTLAAAPASRAGATATTPPSAFATCRNSGYLRAIATAENRTDSTDAHQAVVETGPQTEPERDAAAPTTPAPHRCRRFHV